MLATCVRDVYRRDEAREVRRAIDDIASPLDGYGFASTGVYIFFDPTDFEVLYIGLARDLSERFAQHNGLVRMNENGCKRKQIESWFRMHDELGYAFLGQSSLDQVSVHRQAGTPSAAYWDEETTTFWGYPDHGLEEIKIREGILIGCFVQKHGRLPQWNRMGGRQHAPEMATPGGYALLEAAMGAADSLLVARKTIRGLSADETAMEYEMALHTGRLGAIEDTIGRGFGSPHIWNALVSRATDPLYRSTGLLDVVERIQESRYVLLPPPVPATEDTPWRLAWLPGEMPSGSSIPAESAATWQLMWTDEGTAHLEDMGLDALRCARCASIATLAEIDEDGAMADTWCTLHAVGRGAPQDLIRLAAGG